MTTDNNKATEDKLKEICFKENPHVLDDDMSDFFDDWLASQEPEDWIRHISVIRQQGVKEERDRVLKILKEQNESVENRILRVVYPNQE